MSVTIALLLTLLIPPIREQFKFLLFFFAVFASATGGFWPGVFATLLSVAMAGHFLIHPLRSLAFSHLGDLVPLLIFCGVGITITWITWRLHRTEETLRAAAAVMESSADSIIRGSMENTILSWNKAAERTYGYTAKEVIGRPFSLIVPPDRLEELQRLVESVHHGGSVQNHETVHIRKDGAHFDVALTLSPIQDRDGRIVAVSSIARDITERKRAEAESKRLAAIVNSTDSAILSTTREGLIATWNAGAERMYGYEAEEIKGKHFSIFIPEDQRADLAANQERLFRGEALVHYELENIRKDGSRLPVSLTISPIKDATGFVTGVSVIGRDITERKRAEAAIAERHRLAVLVAEVGVALTGAEGMQQGLQRCAEILARDIDAAFARVWTVNDIEQVLELQASAGMYTHIDGGHARVPIGKFKIGRIAESGEPHLTNSVLEDSWVGDPEWARREGMVAFAGYPLKVEEHVLGVVAAFARRPLTEATLQAFASVASNIAQFIRRKRAEEALIAERHLLHTLMDNLPAMIYFKDRESHFTRINLAHAKLFGLSHPTEAVGKTDFDFFAVEHAQRAYGDEQEIIRTGQPMVDMEEKEAWPDGRVTWASTTKMPLRDANGNIIGTFGVSQNITGRKRAEEELRERELILHAITDSAYEAILMMDPEGHVSFWNQAAQRILGYTRDEALGRDLHELLAPERYRDAHRGQFPEFQRTGRGNVMGKTQEVRALHKDGREIDIALSLSAVQIKGKWHAVGIMRDITEQKRVEIELHRAKEAAEAASRAKGEFLANMSHEIRTPMNGIIGMTELALDTPLSSEQREYLTMVKESSDTLLTLINDILDFSKIEAGKLSLDPTEFSLHDLLASTLRQFAVRANQKGVGIAWGAKPGVPERVIGDAGRLRQVIVNLVGNAIKFTVQGKVVVGVDVESQEEQSTLLHFTVRDTGIGIGPENQKAIFESFTQVDGSTTRKYEGTGLGLAISSRLVQMMGGKIWVESALGEGSTFHFTARLGQAKAAAAESAPKEVVSLRDLAVLVVDDNSTNRKILGTMLRHWSMRPEMAASGEEGLAALERAASAGAPFPLVLLDAQMPGMDGFAWAERTKQDPKLAGATIMLLTSAGQRGDAARCRELGIAAYLVKPIRQAELLEGILAALGNAPGRERAAVITRHTLRENRQKIQILLADDNAINQQLVLRLLGKRGHIVTVASNGREALALLKISRFDLVLMDVQMPEMNGFQATAAIRKEEESTGKHLPIIAMTAHAMEGDRARCLAAGMDGYIAKPIKVEDLVEAIENLGRSPELPKMAPTAKPREQEPIDTASALVRVEGDVELLNELVALFLKDLPALLTKLREAITAGDAKAIEHSAHKLKGSVGNFSAHPAFEAALKLEVLGREGSLSEAEPAYAELEKEIERLISAMANLSGGEVRP
jgi:PAS domain S-box-containing protein